MKLDIKLLLSGILLIVLMYLVLKSHEGDPLFIHEWFVIFVFTWIAFAGFHTRFLGDISWDILNGRIGWIKNTLTVLGFSLVCAVVSFILLQFGIVELLLKNF